MLQGHAVTLTFKVATQMLLVTRRLNMMIISVKYFQNGTSNNEVIGRKLDCQFLQLPDSVMLSIAVCQTGDHGSNTILLSIFCYKLVNHVFM